jgi:hypothetical protein
MATPIDERIEEILEELTDEAGEDLPGVAPPVRHRIEGHGGKRFLASWFDPEAREEANHGRELRRIERATHLKLYQIKAETVIEKAQIHRAAELKAYQQRADEWVKVATLENGGMGILATYAKFRRLAEKIIHQGYDPDTEREVIRALYAKFFGRNGICRGGG